MPYQNVGTPRFYINALEWLESNGSIYLHDKYRTLPEGSPDLYRYDNYNLFQTMEILGGKSFVAILGHNIATWNNAYNIIGDFSPYFTPENTGYTLPMANVANNGSADGNNSVPEYNGFSISTFDGTNATGIKLGAWCDLLKIIIGSYYDMPHSPDLKLTMSREMDGVKRIRTKGGNDLTKVKYSKPPMWGNLAPWELGTASNQQLARSGRRVWDLSFSYLDKNDIFPYSSSVGWESVFSHSNYSIENKLLDDDSFYGQVIHKTNGGQLPFIFQPDKDNPEPDFAICKFDMKSFQFNQVANGVYNAKVKIREVW